MVAALLVASWAVICTFISPSFAENSRSEEWQFSASLYAWAVSLDGDVMLLHGPILALNVRF